MNPALSYNSKIGNLRKSGVNPKLPCWFKQDIPDAVTLERARLFNESRVNTVCQKAKCPNLSFCFKNLKFTFMILGDICTRNCRFCAVTQTKEYVLPVDTEEPYRVSQMVKILGLSYVVITSVTRDDLLDGGASIFAKTIELIHNIGANIRIEVLIPDFQGKVSSLNSLLDAQPDVIAHNIETVPRIYEALRPLADYQLSLGILRQIKEVRPSILSKSSILLGLGEKEEEVISAMEDLRQNQCDILTFGQYLAPSVNHYPVREFIEPGQFRKYREIGLRLGFKAVLSGHLVRSSYQAEKVYQDVAYA
jgi:lipoic acid synthetase